MSENHQAHKGPIVEVLASQLNSQGGIYCPNPSMPLWSSHPRVYLGLSESPQVRCPYCSTEYRLKDGEHFSVHH